MPSLSVVSNHNPVTPSIKDLDIEREIESCMSRYDNDKTNS